HLAASGPTACILIVQPPPLLSSLSLHDALPIYLKAIVEKYANLDLGIDKEVFTALLKEYRSQVDSTYQPELYQTIATEYGGNERDRKSTRLNSSHVSTSYAVFCLKKKNQRAKDQ